MANFIDIKQLSQTDLLALMQQAQAYLDGANPPALENQFVANLFFEPSTRTRCSFEIAAKKLGAHVLTLESGTSSTKKGETVLDTVLNLHAMGVNTFVLRHKQEGLLQQLADKLPAEIALINAGCGTQQHPSQALLDMLTIQQHFADFSALRVAIIGDMWHSRVAHAVIAALQTLGASIHLIGAQALQPEHINLTRVTRFTDIEQGLQNVDVIMSLRLQKERMQEQTFVDDISFHQQYGLTPERLAFAKPNAIVMHPGPLNRGVEITDAVADGPQSVILQQVRNGVAARMAILAWAAKQ